jgi:hypothetical protein
MKNKLTISLGLIFSVVMICLMSPLSSVYAQNEIRPAGDSGMITLGPNQMLRLTVAAGDVNGDDDIRIRFRRSEYIEQGNIYKIGSQSTSAPILLRRGEAASIDIGLDGGFGVRGVVLSNSRKVKVTGIVFDTSTWRVVAFVPMSELESLN